MQLTGFSSWAGLAWLAAVGSPALMFVVVIACWTLVRRRSAALLRGAALAWLVACVAEYAWAASLQFDPRLAAPAGSMGVLLATSFGALLGWFDGIASAGLGVRDAPCERRVDF